MIEYIYFVKCPNCEDEHFSFFKEAQEHALRCLSQKPIITQVEVNRNDFGECVDSCDLGTIWSWEEMMDEPEVVATTFSKVDCCSDYDPECDPEFTELDNSLDYIPDNFKRPSAELEDLDTELTESSVNKFIIVGEYEDYSKAFYNDASGTWVDKSIDATLFDDRNEAIEVLYDLDASDFYTTRVMIKPVATSEGDSSNKDSLRKPIPEGMTIESLVEEMEENEDTVECVCCQELYPKEECKHDEKHGWICPDCADEVVECTWCEELYNRSECRYEVDMGWLCDRCEAAIKSRGETLTFREGSYWDYLDEDMSDQDYQMIKLEVKRAKEDLEDKLDKNTNMLVGNQRILAQMIDKNNKA